MDNYTLRCMEIIKKYYPMISIDSNILAVGMGFKTINNITTNIPCLKVYVAEKISQNNLPKNKIIPPIFNGIITDVVASGESRDYTNMAIPNYNIKPNAELTVPARGGEIIYNRSVNGPSGTLSCAVTEKESKGDSIYILSTSRVIAGNNKGKFGSLIFQKADATPSTKQKVIAAQESNADLKLVPKGTPSSSEVVNETDVGIAYVENTKVSKDGTNEYREESQLIVSGGMFDKKQITFPKVLAGVLKTGLDVYMLSKYSGTRIGKIESISVSGPLPVEDKVAYFRKQLLANIPGVTPYDYGALVFLKDDKVKNKHLVLGMIIGHCGDISKDKVIVTPMEAILAKTEKFIYYYKDQIPIG